MMLWEEFSVAARQRPADRTAEKVIIAAKAMLVCAFLG